MRAKPRSGTEAQQIFTDCCKEAFASLCFSNATIEYIAQEITSADIREYRKSPLLTN
jgi:hypothetical protein